MAVSLSACGGTDTAAVVAPTTPTTPTVTPVSLALTSAQNIITSAELTTGADSIAATQATIGSTDVIVDGTAGDGDTLTVASNGAAINLGTVAGIENIVVNVTDFGAAGVITATNVADGTLTVNNLQAAGSTDAAIDAAGSITIVAGSGVTGDLDVNMAADAATIVNTGGAATVDIDADNTDGEQTASVVVVDDVDLQVVDATTLNISAADDATVTLNASSEDLAGEDSTIAVTGTGVTLVAADADDIDGTVVTGADVTIDTTTDADSAFDARNIAGTLNLADGALVGDVITIASGGTVSFAGADDATALDVNDGATADAATAVANVVFTTASPNATAITVEGTNDVIKTLNVSSDVDVAALTINAVTAVDVTFSGSGDITLLSAGFATTAGSTIDASALSGVLTVTADAQALDITGGSGNDAITALTATEFDLDGGAGVDTLTTAADMTSGTFANFEVLAISTGDDFLSSQLNGLTAAVTSAGAVTLDLATGGAGGDAIDTAVIDLSGLAFQNATDTVSVDLTNIDASVLLSSQGFTYTGSNAIDSVTGSANADVITTGEGADVVVGSAGGDTVDFTESTAAEDVFTQANSANTTFVGFDTGAEATADEVTLDLSIIEGVTGVTDLVNTDGVSVAVASAATISAAFETVTEAATIGGTAGNTAVVIDGDIADADALETALETGGDFALTTTNALGVADAILVLFDDGTNSYLASVSTTAGVGAGAVAAAGDLDATILLSFDGIADATDLVAGNFNDIIA